MKHCVRIAAIILVIAGMTSALAAQLSSASNPHETPAGCHEHGKKSPTHKTPDYKCCVAGHDAALLRSAVIPHPVSQIGSAIPLAAPLDTELLGVSISIARTPPDSASRNLPLRV